MPALPSKLIKMQSAFIQFAAIAMAVTLVTLLPASSAADPIDLATVRFQHYLTGEQMGERGGIGMINDIIQDADGFMWFAGEHGVARFDSHRFRFYFPDYNRPGSIEGNTTYKVVKDRHDQVWFVTNQGLSRYNPSTDNFDNFPVNQNLPSGITQNFLCIATLTDGRFALGSNRGLTFFDPESLYIENMQHADGNLDSPSGSDVRALYQDASGLLWIGYGQAGVSSLDLNTQKFTHYAPFPMDQDPSLQYQITSITEDTQGNVWFGSDGAGLAQLRKDKSEFLSFHKDAPSPRALNSDVVRDIDLDRSGTLWAVLDHGGLAQYNPQAGGFEILQHQKSDPTSLNSDQVRTFYADQNNDLWVGAFPNGINYFDRSKVAFKIIKSHSTGLSHDAILRIFKDSHGIIWIGTERGLNAYDEKTGKFSRYFHDPQNPYSLRSNVVISMIEDNSGQMWFGTWSGGLHKFNRENQHFYNYFPEANNPNSLPNQHVWTLAKDSDGNIWSGHSDHGGLARYRPLTDDFEVFRHDPTDPDSLIYHYVWSLLSDSQNRLWVGTLAGLDLLDKQTKKFVHMGTDRNDPRKLNSDNIYSLLEHSNGDIWIGTDGGGINIMSEGSDIFRQLGSDEGLPSMRVASLAEDNDGYVWAATNNGLAQINPNTYDVTNYHASDGLAGNNHNRNSIFADTNGLLYIGSTEGLTIIDKNKINPTTAPPKVIITQLKIFNDTIRYDSDNTPLRSSIEHAHSIVLNSKQNVFSLEFAALSFRSPNKNRYQYKLEGFDTFWRDATETRIATYTNLDPGKYRFLVRGANSNGVWNKHGAALNIHITPPLWQQWWAYVIYLILAVYAIYGLFQLNTRKMRFELAHRKKLMQLDRMKDAFIASTSHELKTPLNGIIGIAQSLALSDYAAQNPSIKHQLNTIYTSGLRLSSLMDDLLDFSKLSNEQLVMQLGDVDLGEILEQCLTILSPQIAHKPISIENQVPQGTHFVRADKTRLKQIFLHLLENAAKYTESGFIRLTIESQKNKYTVGVCDSGMGIPKEARDQVFSAFSQLNEVNTRLQNGAGIGLAITQKLIKLHGGTIELESQVGKGSTFFVTLPKSNRPAAQTNTTAIKPLVTSSPIDRKLNILVVDDDAVNRLVLSAMIKTEHTELIEAVSGAEAIALLKEHTVDLIILDIMMPGMSGFDVCKKIRRELKLVDLPIIFLSAKRAEDAEQEALAAGGNAYMSKPVNRVELLGLIEVTTSNFRL